MKMFGGKLKFLIAVVWIVTNFSCGKNKGKFQTESQMPSNLSSEITKLILKDSSFDKEKNLGFISKEEAIADFDELSKIIENTQSYVHCHDIHYKALIAEIQSGLKDSMAISQFGIMIHKFVQNLGDGHAKVDGFENYLAKGFTAVKYGFDRGKIIAYTPDLKLLDIQHPYVKSIDGFAVDKWLSLAADITSGKKASASDRFNFGRNTMEYVVFMRNELGLQPKDSVDYRLEDEEGKSEISLSLPIISTKTETIRNAFNLPKESRLLDNNIGYIRLYSHNDKDLTKSLDSLMNAFAETDALILDSRQSGGGTRGNLETLFPYFMKESDPVYIPNVTKLKIPGNAKNFDPRGKLNVGDKKLKYIDEDGVTAIEKRALSKFLEGFKVDCKLAPNVFTDWYFMAIHPDEKRKYYDKPIYLIVDFGVGSAGDIFTSSLKGWRGITVVGGSTNGRSGNSIGFPLKNSGISVRLSTMVSYQKDGSLFDWVGVEPDLKIEPVISDWLGQTDSVLDDVIEMILKENN